MSKTMYDWENYYDAADEAYHDFVWLMGRLHTLADELPDGNVKQRVRELANEADIMAGNVSQYIHETEELGI